MTKEKWYQYTRFPCETLLEGRRRLATFGSKELSSTAFSVSRGSETWHFDNEDEFFSEYRQKDVHQAHYRVQHDNGASLSALCIGTTTAVTVGLGARSEVEHVFQVFESAAPDCKLPKEQREAKLREELTIFIGHGRSPQWRDLKDHLHEKHGFKVEAYETGARAGFTIVEVLQSLTEQAGFALLVMTAEDVAADGSLHPRENVIHETGLLQGKLGFARAIVLLEEGCQEFSNVAGLQQIRFGKGNIKESFGEVLATLRREFEVE